MLGNCVLVPATYYRIKEKYGDSPCNHCINKQFGCPDKNPIQWGYDLFIPIENSPEELPRCKIWCRNCKAENGEIKHEVLWNGKRAYAIECPICRAKFLLYKDKVRYQYTGYKNFKGEFVPPDRYGTRRNEAMERMSRRSDEPDKLVASFGSGYDSPFSTMLDALRRAGLK